MTILRLATRRSVKKSLTAHIRWRATRAQLLSTLSRKNLSTFGRGTFNLNEIFEADAHEADNAVKQAVFENGRFNRAYTHLATALFVAQMALACIACIQAIRRRDTRAAPLFLTLLGAFLF